MKKAAAVLVMLVAAIVWAQTVVDQGAPGKKGPWPVTIAGGISIAFDGGITIANGTVIVATGPDGGAVQVNIVQSIPIDVTGSVAAIIAPVTCGTTILDGGSSEQITAVGINATQIPGAPSTGRQYVNICNSAQNASTAIIKCRQDGVAPVFAVGGAGQVLLFGDCLLSTTLPTTNSIQCITSADAGINITTYECLAQ